MTRVKRKFVLLLAGCLGFFLSVLLWATPQQAATNLDFTFTLDNKYKTSAGVYKSDGTLVRTLWRKVKYDAGTHGASWDGLDDDGKTAPASNYQIKLLYHNMQYEWEGAIGNTSNAQSGATVHHGFYPMRDLAIADNNAFYTTGYNEGQFSFHRFDIKNPQQVTNSWNWLFNPQFQRVENKVSNTYDRNWSWTATDGTWVYFACNEGYDQATGKNTRPGFVTASKASDDSVATFSSGQKIPSGPGPAEVVNSVHDYGQWPYPNGIYVGTQPGLSGMAVQKNGNILAIAVAPDNKIYLLDKRSGSQLKTINVNAPKRIAIAPNGDLWVISDNSVVRFTDLDSNPKIAATISGLTKPLAVTVNPGNNDIVLVADGGSSQQVKAYTSTGSSLWTYGQKGGYQTNGADVRNDKFWFFDGENEATFITFAPDNSFWVGDGGNYRSLHFSPTRSYLEQIMFQPHSYVVSADPNKPSRVTNQYLEFQVNYKGQINQGSWKLVKNWGAGLGPEYFSNFFGLRQVTTLSNGRTYAVVSSPSNKGKDEVVELTGSKLRLTGILLGTTGDGKGKNTVLAADGSLRTVAAGNSQWYKQALTGFDSAGNPQWAALSSLATATEESRDPVPRCCGGGGIRTPITSSNIVVSLDQSKNNGWHLGGVKAGDNKWLWKASPAVTSNFPLDGLGSYDIGDGVNYAGNVAMALGRNIVYGYHGEGWVQSQANQFMHFYDNGLFVGQFGVPGRTYEGFHPPGEVVAGFAGNSFSPELVSVNGELYMWVNDESAHGPQRWHLIGTKNIAELSGSGNLGSSVTLK